MTMRKYQQISAILTRKVFLIRLVGENHYVCGFLRKVSETNAVCSKLCVEIKGDKQRSKKDLPPNSPTDEVEPAVAFGFEVGSMNDSPHDSPTDEVEPPNACSTYPAVACGSGCENQMESNNEDMTSE